MTTAKRGATMRCSRRTLRPSTITTRPASRCNTCHGATNVFEVGTRTQLLERDLAAIQHHHPISERHHFIQVFTDKVTNTYPTLLVSVVLAAFLFWFMRTSNYGYETAVYADSPNTARYAGMNSMRLQSSVLLISGAIAGVGGAMYVVGPAGKVDPGLLQIGLGYAGIVVAALARYNFLAVVIAAILFAGLRTGGNALQVSNDPVPIAIAIVLQGAVLLFALGGELFRRNRVVISRVGQAVPT
ncbi:MAG: ABC transporter permease [Actinobacteria bacterium]|nr:ABC transporter permease [Actinomycetota bacterium]